jgi:signal transduction histidine kinase
LLINCSTDSNYSFIKDVFRALHDLDFGGDLFRVQYDARTFNLLHNVSLLPFYHFTKLLHDNCETDR